MGTDEETTLTSSSSLSVVPSKTGMLAATNLQQSSSSTGNSSTSNSKSRSDTRVPPSGHRRPQRSVEGALDFIGTGPAVKTLFSIPIAEQSVCVAVHNIDGTLLIDEIVPEATDDKVPEEKSSSRRQQQSTTTRREPTSSLPLPTESLALALYPDGADQQEALSALSQLIQRVKDVDMSQDDVKDGSIQSIVVPSLSPSPVREYVEWKFQDLNLLVGSDAVIVRPDNSGENSNAGTSTGVVIRVEEVQKLRSLVETKQQNQKSLLEEEKHDNVQPSSPRSYADVLLQPSRTTPLLTDGGETDSEDRPTTTAPLNLDQVQLQTCIVPGFGPLCGLLQTSRSVPSSTTTETAGNTATTAGPMEAGMASSKCIVLDAYLDTLMTNVPQLALCLQEKGLIQSVKLMDRDQIPAMMMHPSTLDTTKPVELIQSSSTMTAPDLFSPEIMEMNATALLRFLKANCTSNNTTYLLRTDASATDGNYIQLYDISSISQQRQKKWIWWLATMSYRFALRLRQLESHDVLPMRQRAFRDRQRNLLQTTLDLLQDLRDMDGNAHESMVASVREHMADTFLGESSASSDGSQESSVKNGNNSSSTPTASPSPVMASSPTMSSSPTVSTSAMFEPSAKMKNQPGEPPAGSAQQPRPDKTQHQPYSTIATDALNKAQDNLVMGIKVLSPILESQLKDSSNECNSAPRRRRRGMQVPVSPEPTASSPSPAMVLQLFELNYKVVNVSLRLAEHYLRQYSSSNAMQSLRHAARRMVDSIALLEYIPTALAKEWIPRLKLQYTWLWEHCGHFARSFASDDLWRERGYATGDDVLYVLRDVEAAFASETLPFDFSKLPDPLRSKTKGLISLQALSALYAPSLGELKRTKKQEPEFWEEARKMLAQQGLLQRDKRQVLVASCISYRRAIVAYEELMEIRADDEQDSPVLLSLLRQRLGDACNETGKVLLASLRMFLTNGGSGSSSMGLADVLLDSSQFWFLEALDAFDACHDQRNIALVRCNLCQCCKLRANNSFASQATSDASHAEVCLEKAASHLQTAHERLGTKDTDPMTWDMVSNELAATFLVLAVRRRQSLLGGGATPVVFEAMRLSPGKERSILEPMEKALTIYQQSGNLHQAAAVHYQLALTNSKIWTCQRDETKTREKLSAAFSQYKKAYDYFLSHIQGNEPTVVLLCLDIASLYAAVSGEECLAQALMTCLDTIDVFDPEIVEKSAKGSSDWLEKMETLATSVDDRIFKLLRSLVKLNSDRWKNLYRAGLASKMSKAEPDSATSAVVAPVSLELWRFHLMLVSLRDEFNVARKAQLSPDK